MPGGELRLEGEDTVMCLAALALADGEYCGVVIRSLRAAQRGKLKPAGGKRTNGIKRHRELKNGSDACGPDTCHRDLRADMGNNDRVKVASDKSLPGENSDRGEPQGGGVR